MGCLTLEYCDGGELFNLMGDGRMPEREVRRTHRQMLLGVRYLHHHNIGHRDISLENILLKDGNVRLADFGQAVQVHAVPRTEDPTSPAFRYFRLAGKDYYRAPEGYVFYRRSQAVCPDDYVNGSIVMVQVQVPAPAPTHRGHLALVSFTEAAVPGQVSPVETAGYALTSSMCLLVGCASSYCTRRNRLGRPRCWQMTTSAFSSTTTYPMPGNAKPLCVDYSSGGKYRCRPKTQWICCPGSYCRTQMRGALCRNPSTTRGSLNLERRGPQQSVSDRSWPACAGVRSSACSVAK